MAPGLRVSTERSTWNAHFKRAPRPPGTPVAEYLKFSLWIPLLTPCGPPPVAGGGVPERPAGGVRSPSAVLQRSFRGRSGGGGAAPAHS
eukprot:2549505-Pyramimonas_sp.AAC.1